MKLLDPTDGSVGESGLGAYASDVRLSTHVKARLWDRIDASLDADPAPPMPPRASSGTWYRSRATAVVAAASVVGALGLGLGFGGWLRPNAAEAEDLNPRPFMATHDLNHQDRDHRGWTATGRTRRAPTVVLPRLSSTPPTTGPEPAPERERRVRKPVPSTKRHDTTTRHAPDAATGLHREMELLRRARASLRARHFDDALRWLDQHARDYPHGQLVEDRRALRIAVLCTSGRAAEGRRLLARSGSSGARPRLHALCRDDAGTDRRQRDE